MPGATDQAPIAPGSSRIEALDVVRGVAVAGILFANVIVFFGLFVIPPERASQLPTAAIDPVAAFAGHVLVDGKFYSIFSLLFGIGFGLQLARGGDARVTRFRRRLRVLLGIGAVHAFFIWAGDILMLYALLGFTLPWFARRPDAGLLRWAVGLLAIPTTLYAIGTGLWMALGPADTGAATSPGMPPEILARFAAMGTGGLLDALIGNLILLVGRWAELVATVRFPKVLGMFVLGLWAARTGLALAPHAHRATLVRWRRLGWLIGLPANIVAAWAATAWPYLPPSPGGLLGVVAQAVGYPMLAIGYATTITLLVLDGSRVSRFAPVGRLALTNYLMQSIVCVALSYGFGLALWWRVGTTGAMGIAVLIVLVQLPLSAWWLARFQFGPAEWVWRRLTSREPLPMRRIAAQ